MTYREKSSEKVEVKLSLVNDYYIQYNFFLQIDIYCYLIDELVLIIFSNTVILKIGICLLKHVHTK